LAFTISFYSGRPAASRDMRANLPVLRATPARLDAN
jgi:hypothetical protein